MNVSNEEDVADLRRAGIADAAAELRRLARWVAAEGGDKNLYRQAVEKRRRRIPFSHISGRRWFWQHAFEVTPAVLDPRPDSECLVAAALAAVAGKPRPSPLRILDLGTGSGCLLLSVLAALPGATGVGVDISAPALAVARRNAVRLGCQDRCLFVQGDWGERKDEKFDLVLVNPPYLSEAEIVSASGELAWEPREALAGGGDGLACYRQLAPLLATQVALHGYGLLEIGAGQETRVEEILATAGLSVAASHRDLDGRVRCLEVGPLELCDRGATEGLEVGLSEGSDPHTSNQIQPPLERRRSRLVVSYLAT